MILRTCCGKDAELIIAIATDSVCITQTCLADQGQRAGRQGREAAEKDAEKRVITGHKSASTLPDQLFELYSPTGTGSSQQFIQERMHGGIQKPSFITFT